MFQPGGIRTFTQAVCQSYARRSAPPDPDQLTCLEFVASVIVAGISCNLSRRVPLGNASARRSNEIGGRLSRPGGGLSSSCSCPCSRQSGRPRSGTCRSRGRGGRSAGSRRSSSGPPSCTSHRGASGRKRSTAASLPVARSGVSPWDYPPSYTVLVMCS